MGVLPPLFQKTVLLNGAWTAVVTVARTAVAMVAENVYVSVAGTAGDTAADTAAGAASIITLMNFQMSVSDLLPCITLLVTFSMRMFG